ncbi:Hsp20/alpha crystallin family protein [Bacillus sp. FJAT-29937]|uniref:Hsp20/alpha crystallin family protein n=1 Tax=Bacillus sp. FJAT-29937 TaxID=1720553 RepID=UPI00082FB284|nr:Hsp20/alpha crystallin family protein [Bacillus sp. FJAT-29937]
MEIEKLKQWLDLTKQYQSQGFWNEIFDHNQAQATEELASNFFSNQDIFPRCDMYGTDECIIVEAELPGVEIADIKVFLQQSELILRGECKTVRPSFKYYLKERPNRTFEKKITIPAVINKHEIQTQFDKGILSIILPFNYSDDENIPIMVNNDESAPIG